MARCLFAEGLRPWTGPGSAPDSHAHPASIAVTSMAQSDSEHAGTQQAPVTAARGNMYLESSGSPEVADDG